MGDNSECGLYRKKQAVSKAFSSDSSIEDKTETMKFSPVQNRPLIIKICLECKNNIL